MSPVQDRVLILGLARSGRAAVAVLRHLGADVVAYDADAELDASGIDAEVHLGPWRDELLDAPRPEVDLGVDSRCIELSVGVVGDDVGPEVA